MALLAPTINPLTRTKRQPAAAEQASQNPPLSSRDKLTTTIRRTIKRGQHVLLTGEYGSGRSWMLNRMMEEFPEAINLSLTQSKRAVILTVCQRLFDDGKLAIDADDWGAVSKKLRPMTIPQLCDLIDAQLGDYIVFLDDLDKATEKTVEEIVKPLMAAIVLATADISTPSKRKRTASVLDRFKQLDMPPLDQHEAQSMLWSQLDRATIKHAGTIEKKILRIAAGVPGVIFDLCEKLRGSNGSLADIRDIEHSNTQIKRINLGIPMLFAALIFLMASRYIFRGYDDGSLIMLAGVGSVLASIILRPMIYKMMD